MMLIPTGEIKQVYKFLFENGCVVVKDDTKLERHSHINVSNLKVMQIMKSLTSRGVVTRTFVWMHAYYKLTDDVGIKYLRGKLYLDDSQLPATHNAVAASEGKGAGHAGAPSFRRAERAAVGA